VRSQEFPIRVSLLLTLYSLLNRGEAMIPGEIKVADGAIELNVGRKTLTLEVTNSGDRPIQVGSHFHFFETNEALKFDRKKSRGLSKE